MKIDWGNVIEEAIGATISTGFIALVVHIYNLVMGNARASLWLWIGLGALAIVIVARVWRAFGRLLSALGRWIINHKIISIAHILVILGALVLRVYTDWRILAFSLACYTVGVLSWKLSIDSLILSSRNRSTEKETQYLPISLVPGIGNSYFRDRYIAPPSGDVLLGGVQFRLEPNTLIFDTNEQIRSYLPRDDGGKEVDFPLPQPQNQIKSVYFLINSCNSKSIYAHQVIGEIRLIFRDAPPIVVELVLGKNIREWCPGNPGDFVRETSSPMLTMDVWTGLAKNGASAVIDRLQIPVFECMRDCFLEKIVLIHKCLQRSPDTMGVHFSIFAVSLEIVRNM